MSPDQLVQWALEVWIAVLAAVFAYRLVTGGIRTDGLLSVMPGRQVEPERIVLLIATVAGAAYYAMAGLEAAGSADGNAGSLPDVPDEVLFLFGGGQFFYLTGKLTRSIKP